MPPETDTMEEERAMALAQARRASSGPQTSGPPSRRIRIAPAEGMLVAGLMLLLFDVPDYLILGSIPAVGDVWDVIGGAILWLWIKIRIGTPWYISASPWIATGVEVIPFIGDLPPSFALDVLFILAMNSRWGRRFMKILSPT